MTERRPDHIKFSGRILFLTEDTALIRQQLEATGDDAAAPFHSGKYYRELAFTRSKANHGRSPEPL